MKKEGFSTILIIIGILVIVSATFGIITIFKNKITASISDIFKNSNTEIEKANTEDLVFQPQEPQLFQQDPAIKTGPCKAEATRKTRQDLIEYEQQLKADWPNYLGATYDDLMKIYSDPSGSKYVRDPQARISTVETALNSAQQTIQKKLSETEAAVYPQYLQECLNK